MTAQAPFDPPQAVGRVLVGFARALRAAGLGVSPAQLSAFARALGWLDPCSRSDVYHAARTTLLTRREDLGLFDRVFESVWVGAAPGRGQKLPLAPRQRHLTERPALAMLLGERARPSDPAFELRDRSRTASADELLRQKDFALMTEAELASLRHLLELRRFPFATRVTRRTRPRRSGRELDLRRAAARAAKSGGVLAALPRRAARIKPRPLVLLADVSGSMELYTRVLLTFMHALRQRLGDVETFVFATRLTRITSQLALTNVDQALDEVAGSVIDFASGTRIAECLHRFNSEWAGRVLGRGAVLIVMSDGWERGSPEQLKKEMRISRERCHRLVWLNPRLGQPHYQPLVAGMSAALGQVDDFLPCHDLGSLQAVAQLLSALPRRRGERPSQVSFEPRGAA